MLEKNVTHEGLRGAGTFLRRDGDELLVAVEACLRRLADRIDRDSARSSDRKDLSAVESRRGWRVK